MNAKNIIVKHEKKGNIPLGKLSHNELCRGVQSLMLEVQKGNIILNSVYLQYANHIASVDCMNLEEVVSYFDL